MKNKQNEISEILRQRINSGVYTDKLPDTRTLSVEFGVNIKTMASAINHLVATGILERKRRSGTKILRKSITMATSPLVEVIFSGEKNIFSHPFWGEIWDGLVSRLAMTGYRPVLNILKHTPRINLKNFSLTPSAGRVILGTFDERIFHVVQSDGIPYISACDHINLPDIPQVTLDFTYGIQNAVDFLFARGYKKIGFIGQVKSDYPIRIPHKYLAYCEAMNNNSLENFIETEHANLSFDGGASALKKMFNRSLPEALIVAHDHHLPEMLQLIHELKIQMPIIACDGLDLPGLVHKRCVVRAPLHECGETIARQIISGIVKNCQPTSIAIPASFVNARIKLDLAAKDDQ